MWAINIISCKTTRAEEVTVAQLKAYVYGPQGHYSTMFKGVRYAGRDAQFDYIALAYSGRVGSSKLFKVRAGELSLKSHMCVKRNPSEWVDASAVFPFPLPTVT